MFTDEKMEQVYTGPSSIKATMKVLMDTMPMEHITTQELRRANNIWLLFCKRHPELRPEGFRDIMCKINPGKEDIIINLLK